MGVSVPSTRRLKAKYKRNRDLILNVFQINIQDQVVQDKKKIEIKPTNRNLSGIKSCRTDFFTSVYK